MSNSKVLFSHSYFYRLDAKQWKIAEPFPPLMTITAASYLRENGYEVDLFDVGLKKSEEGLEKVLDRFQPNYFVIFDDGFNWLTKMCLTTMRQAAFRMQKIAKARGIKVITCSSDSTDHEEKYLKNGADFVIKGEGEETLLELINSLEQKSDTSEVHGLSFEENGQVSLTTKRPPMRELDKLPLPAWDLVDIDQYTSIWQSKNKVPYLNVATTRGCPYKCNWCAKPIYGNRYNARSPQHVVDEIAIHVHKHGIDHFWMCDDIFGLKPGWVQEFRDELQKRNLNINYKIQSRADLLLKEDTIDALVDSGLAEVWIGAESGSQEILDAMDKGTTIEQIEESSKILKSFGVRVAFFIQFGYLNETMSDIKKTVRMVLDLMPDKLGISVSYPLPGTKFYDRVKSDLKMKSNWVDSDDLDMMFENTYPKRFYKVLHRYLHNRFKIKRGLLTAKDILANPLSTTSSKVKNLLSGIFNVPKLFVNNALLIRARINK